MEDSVSLSLSVTGTRSTWHGDCVSPSQSHSFTQLLFCYMTYVSFFFIFCVRPLLLSRILFVSLLLFILLLVQPRRVHPFLLVALSRSPSITRSHSQSSAAFLSPSLPPSLVAIPSLSSFLSGGPLSPSRRLPHHALTFSLTKCLHLSLSLLAVPRIYPKSPLFSLLAARVGAAYPKSRLSLLELGLTAKAR